MNPFSVSPWQSATSAAVGGSVDPSTLVGSGTSSNSSGNTTISVGSKISHKEVTTFSGAGGTTRIMVVETVGPPVNGARLSHRLVLPATAGITIEWRSGSAVGALITSMITDGSGDDARLESFFDGSAWKFDDFTYPSNAS